MADYLVRREIKERKVTIDAELQELWQRIYRVEARQDQDWRKQERYCREQREVLRALEDLACKEREMYELDNRPRSGHDRLQGCAGECSHVDARPVFSSHLCSRHMETSCTLFSPSRAGDTRTESGVSRVASLQRSPTQLRSRRAV